MTKDAKPREFWIEYCPEKSITGQIDVKPIEPFYGEWKNIYRVINIDAYEQVKAERDELKARIEKERALSAELVEVLIEVEVLREDDTLMIEKVLAKYEASKGAKK